MWEFIAFVLWGLVAFVGGAVWWAGASVERGFFTNDGARYRVTKIEE